MTTPELGPVVRRHRVANGRVLATGLLAVVAAAALFVALVLAIDAPAQQHETRSSAPVFLVPGLLLVIGVIQLARVVRSGIGEYFEVRTDGVVRGNRSGSTGWAWDSIEYYWQKKTPPNRPPSRIGRVLSNTFGGKVWFADGRSIRFYSTAEHSGELAEAIRRHCRRAPMLPVQQSNLYRGRWVLLAVGTVALVGAAWLLVLVTGPDSRTLAHGQLLVVAMFYLFLIAVVCGGTFRYLVIQPRRPQPRKPTGHDAVEH